MWMMTMTVASKKRECIDSIHFNPVLMFLADETPASNRYPTLQSQM
jgi:hypothetical protein